MAKRNLRTLLIQLLTEAHLLSVADILKQLKQQGRKFNKTSVYRALEQLLADEVICRHYFTQAEAVYELRDHQHAHLVCTTCGSISTTQTEIDLPEVENFQINHHHLTLVGVCQTCASS